MTSNDAKIKYASLNCGIGVMCLHMFVMHKYSFKPCNYFIKLYTSKCCWAAFARLEVGTKHLLLLFCHDLLFNGIWYLGFMFEHNCTQTLWWKPTYNPSSMPHIVHRYKQLQVVIHLFPFHVQMFILMLVFILVSKIQ